MLDIPAETERLVRLVAAQSGKSPEDVVREAIEREATAAGVMVGRRARAVDMAQIDAITRRAASRPLLDTRSAKEILDDAWGDLT